MKKPSKTGKISAETKSPNQKIAIIVENLRKLHTWQGVLLDEMIRNLKEEENGPK